MSQLIDSFPALTAALSRSLRAMKRNALADQINDATIDRTTFDDGAAFIYLLASHELDATDLYTAKGRYEHTLEVETPYGTYIDINEFDQVTGIEILNAHSFKHELERFYEPHSGVDNKNDATPISSNPYAAPQSVAERVRSAPRTSLFHQLIGWTCAILCASFGVGAFANLIAGDFGVAAGSVFFTLLFGWLARDFVKNTTYDGR